MVLIMALPNTHYGRDGVGALLRTPKKIRFLGIGGVSMRSLARVAALRGHSVSGYDRTLSEATAALVADGIPVDGAERPELAAAAGLIVYTVAVAPDNAELIAAREAGVPCVSRADFLGWAMSGYAQRVGVAGTHGKSTTTAMLAKIFTDAGADPTVNCGAVIRDLGDTHRVGRSGDYFIFEACEYMDSFLDFYPTTAVLLNAELDHPDYYKSTAQLRDSFSRFLALTEEERNAAAIVNADDDNSVLAAAGYDTAKSKKITFGIEKNADFTARGISLEGGRPAFELYRGGERLASVKMTVPGRHSIYDALAAAAASTHCGIDPLSAAASLSEFRGAGRRMELMGRTPLGAEVYEDYAHHPTEIAVTLTGAADMCRRVAVVFQPHTYSRLAKLYRDFTEALSLADAVIVADVYAARETDTLGVSGAGLARDVKGAVYLPDFASIAAYVRESFGEGDLVVVMGAGDIDGVTPLITAP